MKRTSEHHSEDSVPSTPPSPPSSWPALKKWSTLLTAYLVCFVVGINSTAILSAADDIADEFHIHTSSFDYTFFLATAWNTGAAIVPLVILPAMEDYGVRPIYVSTYVLFAIFVAVQAVAPNFATLIVSRVIAGSCGGVLQNALDGVAADIWTGEPRRLALSLTAFIFALLGGVTVGPVIGGGILSSLDWRWVTYVQLIIYGCTFPLVVIFFHETRTQVAHQKKSFLNKSRMRSAMNETVLRPSRMLCTDFVLGSFTLWSAFSFGTVFLLTQSIPLVYTSLYAWPAWKTGVIQIAIVIGELVGILLCVVQDVVIYPRFVHSTRASPITTNTTTTTADAEQQSQQTSADSQEKSRVNTEARLYTAIPASFLGLAAGFFVYGWTSSSADHYSWVLPTIGLFLIGVGIMVVVQAVAVYITEYYGELANSAVSAVAFGENIFAAFLPLATRDLYRRLGFPWASSLLGFIALGISVAPVVLVVFGARMRHSK